MELSFSSTKTGSKIERSLENLLHKAYQNNQFLNNIIKAKQEGLWKLPADLTKQGIKFAMGDLTLKGIRSGTRLYVKGKMYVPNGDNLRLFLLQQHHNSPSQGHPGYKAIFGKMLENWYWLGMPQDWKQYATNCATCRRTKAFNTQKQGLLNPLPVPSRKWIDLSLNFVVNLPQCRRQNQASQHILVVVDRLTKRRLYELLETLHTREFIEAMNCWVFLSHDFPLSIVNDREGQMTSTL